MMSRFQEINGPRILEMKETCSESQGIHTTIMRIVLGMYVYQIDDKFLGKGMIVPGNQVSRPI